MSFAWARVFLAAAIVAMAAASTRDFWGGNCGNYKRKLAGNEEVTNRHEVTSCIRDCFKGTTETWHTVTANDCFNSLVKPFIIKVLKQQIPTDEQIQKCVNGQDRSQCEHTLLYYFSKWYTEKYSAEHQKTFAGLLYHSWAHIPDIFPGFMSSSWLDTAGEFLGIVIRDLTYQNVQAAIKATSVSDPATFPVIHREMRRYCYQPINADNFRIEKYCWLRVLMNIAVKVRTVAKNKEQYRENFDNYVAALKTNFVALKSLKSWMHDDYKKKYAVLMDEQLNNLTALSAAGNTQKLLKYVNCVPEPFLFAKACKGRYQELTHRFCILEKVVEQLVTYSNLVAKRTSSSNRKAVTINLSLNLRTVISERRGEQILKVLIEWRYQDLLSQEKTAGLIEGKFDQLKNYFVQLQSFNMQKANADVAYVKGRIEYYDVRARNTITDVSEIAGGVLRAALIVQGFEVAEKVVKLTFAIAEACNPFKAVFNGGSASDILDATAELAKAIAGLTEASALKRAWSFLIATAKEISAGFLKNSEFLYAVGRLVAKVKLSDFPEDEEFEKCKSTFLRLYNDYTPQVEKQLLEIFASRMETAVSSGCDLIDGVSGATSNAFVAYVKSNLYCQRATAVIAGLKTVFDEIYDFQFEFIENMASYLRSATGFQASQQMVTRSATPVTPNVDINEQRRQLRATIIMAHNTYEAQKESAVQSLCDFLEYKDGGNAPAACRATNVDVPTLLSYNTRRCRSLNKYVSIPTTTSATVPAGHINLKKLYSGEDVSFDIPDYNWMRQNKWIGRNDDLAAVFIRSFEIFLPSVSAGGEEVQVNAKPMGGNQFPTKGTKYTLIPSTSFTTTYTAGRRFSLCSGRKIENLYTLCEDRKLPKLCVMSDVPTYDEENRLYPTAFARFKIRASGVASSSAPNPETPLDVKAKINMCILDRSGRSIRRARRSTPGCCTGNNYWNEQRGACQLCANGSTANLNGYYCEKNQDAVSQKKKK